MGTDSSHRFERATRYPCSTWVRLTGDDPASPEGEWYVLDHHPATTKTHAVIQHRHSASYRLIDRALLANPIIWTPE